jgi:hypothetical protein|tara:strand:+ start:669 stop:845 length:177 start_codon:yes stop_codon:yes gene_type:complete
MRVKAKESYKKLSDDKNMCSFLSPSKHQRLINDEIVNITDVPKSLKMHLEDVDKKEGK